MEPDRLYPSIYGEDDEAYAIWTKEIGVPGIGLHAFTVMKTASVTTSGSMVQVLVVHVQRFIMTEERNMAVENLIVR